MSAADGAPTEVRLERPEEGVALVTVAGPAPGVCSFALVDRLAERLAEAREGGARVSVLASEVPGYWLFHASLADLGSLFRGEPTEGSGAGFFRVVHELAQTYVVSIAAVSGDCAGGGAEIGWACDLRVVD